jgi:hypothetical protein
MSVSALRGGGSKGQQERTIGSRNKKWVLLPLKSQHNEKTPFMYSGVTVDIITVSEHNRNTDYLQCSHYLFGVYAHIDCRRRVPIQESQYDLVGKKLSGMLLS